jgi:hypothetical protein
MKKYGLRIGNIGVEFVSQQDREKALLNFTKGTDVIISDSGIRFIDGNGSFSIYDRDTKEVIVNCNVCKGVFGIDSCGKRTYPYKHPWESSYSDTENYICDACLASQEKAKRVFEAKELLNEEE